MPEDLVATITGMPSELLDYIEDGQYRNAITTLESIRDWAVREQIKESIEDPGLDLRDLKDND
jgi:hypothetical protein